MAVVHEGTHPAGASRPINPTAHRLRQSNPSGKISLSPSGKSLLGLTPSCPRGKGRWPSSPNVGMGCGGRGGVGREVCSQGGFRERATARRTYDAEAYGEVVWS